MKYVEQIFMHSNSSFSIQGRDRIIEEAQQISKIQKQVGMQVPLEYEETSSLVSWRLSLSGLEAW